MVAVVYGRHGGGRYTKSKSALASWTRPLGVRDGVKMDNETITIKLRGKYLKQAGAPAIGFQKELLFTLHHVDSSGVETELASGASSTLTTSWENFTFVRTFTQLWGTGERLKIRVREFLAAGLPGE